MCTVHYKRLLRQLGLMQITQWTIYSTNFNPFLFSNYPLIDFDCYGCMWLMLFREHLQRSQVSCSQPMHLSCELSVTCGHSEYHLGAFLLWDWRSGAFTSKRSKMAEMQRCESCASEHSKGNVIHMGKKHPEKLIKQIYVFNFIKYLQVHFKQHSSISTAKCFALKSYII